VVNIQIHPEIRAGFKGLLKNNPFFIDPLACLYFNVCGEYKKMNCIACLLQAG